MYFKMNCINCLIAILICFSLFFDNALSASEREERKFENQKSQLLRVDGFKHDENRQNGMNFLDDEWSSFKYDSEEAFSSLEQLYNTTGLNYIALTFCWYQWSVDLPGPIHPINGTSATDSQIIAIVKKAHSLGIRVMVRPLVDPDWSNPHNNGKWRGMIGENFTDSDWATWFESYKQFLNHFAELSEEIGADELCVGGELVTAQLQTSYFRQIIHDVRKRYNGPILYAANWGSELDVQFWDDVDYIAIDAYYPLAPLESDPNVPDIVKAWNPILNELANLSATYGNKPILFAEVGYCSCDSANSMPANINCGSMPLNLDLQWRLYESLFEVFYSQSWFKGVFWWAETTTPTEGGETDHGFTPKNKPTQTLLQKWYKPHSSD